MIQIITTIGTSIITNFLNSVRDSKPNLLNWLKEIRKTNTFSPENPEFCQIRELIKKNWQEEGITNYKLSAEITSLNLLKQENPKEQDLQIKFVLTDTAEAKYSRILIADFLQNESRFNKDSLNEEYLIEGLQVNDPKLFEDLGLLNLINQVKSFQEHFSARKPKGKNDKIILNLTGGYKGMIPFLTLFGQLYEIQINYIYEFSDKIIKFPQIPIQFDWFKAETYYNYLIKLIPFSPEDELLKELENYSLIKVNQNDYSLTSVGNLFLNYISEKNIVDNRVIGHTMEYKLLEFYLANPYADKYFYLERSVPLKNPSGDKKGSDIDLMMKEEASAQEYLMLECKPYHQIIEFKKFAEQLTYQVELFEKNNWYPQEYLLHIYADHPAIILPSELKNALQKLKKVITEKCPSTDFKAKVFYTGITNPKDKKKNPYADFMSRKLEKIEDFAF